VRRAGHRRGRRRGRHRHGVAPVSDPGALVCATCGEEHPLWGAAWRCACGGPLSWRPGAPAPEPPARTGLWRWAEHLPPVAAAHRVTLGEVATPVLDAGDRRLKLEYFSPSGSFKDRGSAVLASALRQMGVTAATLDSSGNAGAAGSAYLAAAGIAATVFVPAHTSPGKLRQIRAYGSRLELVDGGRAETTAAAQAAAVEHGARYASHLWSPFFVAGMRTFAFELARQGDRPDAIVFPVGSGSLLLGAYDGFRVLRDAGLVERIPRLFGAQVDVCAPLADAFAAGLDSAEDIEVAGGGSIAEGILIAAPPRSREILAAVRDSGGGFVTVDDAQVAAARDALARAGVYAEPTSAVAQAGFAALARAGAVPADRSTLVVLTGSGLKAS